MSFTFPLVSTGIYRNTRTGIEIRSIEKGYSIAAPNLFTESGFAEVATAKSLKEARERGSSVAADMVIAIEAAHGQAVTEGPTEAVSRRTENNVATVATTREAWLHNAIETLRPRFEEVGMPLPERVHISVGFSFGAKAESGVVLGQCWARIASKDGVNHIFISPELSDTARVLDVLIHELIHAADDCANGHSGPFAEAATRLGLTGKMTATVASVELAAEMITLSGVLGEYPHGEFIGRELIERARETPRVKVGKGGRHAEPRVSSGPRAQVNRQLLLECTQENHPCHGYKVRTTLRWLEIGTPKCPMGIDMTPQF